MWNVSTTEKQGRAVQDIIFAFTSFWYVKSHGLSRSWRTDTGPCGSPADLAVLPFHGQVVLLGPRQRTPLRRTRKKPANPESMGCLLSEVMNRGIIYLVEWRPHCSGGGKAAQCLGLENKSCRGYQYGGYIPQRRYSSYKNDQISDSERGALITFSVNGKCGFSVRSALEKRYAGLDGRDDHTFVGFSSAITFRSAVLQF